MNEGLVLITVFLSLFVAGVLVIIFHETGHALAYLLLTKPERIDVYIGSYADRGQYLYLKVGRIHYHLKKSFPVKGIGLCISSKSETDYRWHIIILLAGVVLTLFVALAFYMLVVFTGAGLLLQIFAYIFLGLSAISFVFNLVPMRLNGIRNYTKEYSKRESDGRQIFFAIKARKVYARYVNAYEHIGKKETQQAIDELKIVLNQLPNAEKILRLLYSLCMPLKQYADAETYLAKLEQLNKADTEDLLNLASIRSFARKHDAAIAGYQKVLAHDRQNTVALNNLGYEMIKKGAHKVAAPILEKAIKLKPKFIFPYCNLAYSKILQGELWEGKQFIDKAIGLNPNCAPIYVIEAIYYLKMNKREEADACIARAIRLDADVVLYDYNEELEKFTTGTLA